MPITALPEKTDGSIGRVKTDIGSPPNLDNYTPSAEYERLKTAVIDLATEVGLSDGSTTDSLNERVAALEGGGGGGTLQDAYNAGRTVEVTPEDGPIELEYSDDVQVLLKLKNTGDSTELDVTANGLHGDTNISIKPDISTEQGFSVEVDVGEGASTTPEVILANVAVGEDYVRLTSLAQFPVSGPYWVILDDGSGVREVVLASGTTTSPNNRVLLVDPVRRRMVSPAGTIQFAPNGALALGANAHRVDLGEQVVSQGTFEAAQAIITPVITAFDEMYIQPQSDGAGVNIRGAANPTGTGGSVAFDSGQGGTGPGNLELGSVEEFFQANVTAFDSINLNAPEVAVSNALTVDGRRVVGTAIEVLSGTSDTMADADDGKLIECTNGSTVDITVPTGLTPGVTVEYAQAGAGQVRILAGGGMTLKYPATYDPYTNEQESTVIVTILTSTTARVRGDLAV